MKIITNTPIGAVYILFSEYNAIQFLSILSIINEMSKNPEKNI
jgi:hypothetical protein